MIRFAVRFLGCFLLAAAVVFAVGDIARSISVDDMRLTPLSDAFVYVGFGDAAPASAESAAPTAWQQRLTELRGLTAEWPASVALAVLAFILLIAGEPRRTRRRALR